MESIESFLGLFAIPSSHDPEVVASRRECAPDRGKLDRGPIKFHADWPSRHRHFVKIVFSALIDRISELIEMSYEVL